ncbi:MAG: acylphosphatase [Candidatus Gygaella obscura]|nr:acylphosphatase [Candidatus Gygaella obscura]
MKKHVKVIYSGRVQGVGFRYNIDNIAKVMNVYGWIKNLEDGRVILVAEDKKAVLEKFLDQINNFFSDYIKKTNVEWSDAIEDFNIFEVKF